MDVEPVRMPEFIRRALLAQGKYDPDEIEAKAQVLDLTAPSQEEIVQERLIEVAEAALMQVQEEAQRDPF